MVAEALEAARLRGRIAGATALAVAFSGVLTAIEWAGEVRDLAGRRRRRAKGGPRS